MLVGLGDPAQLLGLQAVGGGLLGQAAGGDVRELDDVLGPLALAIATGLEAFEGGADLPYPDLGEADGHRFVSQPVAIRLLDDGVRIERIPETPAHVGSEVVILRG